MNSVKIIGEKFQTSEEINPLFSIRKNILIFIFNSKNEKDRRKWKNE